MGHSVIISNYDKKYGDYYLVNGILNHYQKENQGSTKIYINSPIGYQNTELNSKRNEKVYKGLFYNFPNRQKNWINTQILAIKKADVILLIGGENLTRTTGIAATISKKKVVPIGSFGGASKEILDNMENLMDINDFKFLKSEQQDYDNLHNPWDDNVMESVTQLLGIEKYPTLIIIHGRNND